MKYTSMNNEHTLSLTLMEKMGEDVEAILKGAGATLPPDHNPRVFALECAPLWFPRQRADRARALAAEHAPAGREDEVTNRLAEYGRVLFETVTGR